jgi:hypothetical protein
MDKEEFLKRMGQKIRDLRNDRAWTLYDMEALTDIDSGDLSKNLVILIPEFIQYTKLVELLKYQ